MLDHADPHAAADGDPNCFLIIDDHPLFCEALSMTLKSLHRSSAVRTAGSLAEGLERIAEGLEPDAILLDLNLPDVNSLDGLTQVRAARPETPVVVISSIKDAAVIARVMRAGAAGFIPKDTPREELTEAFRRIWLGDVYAPPGFEPIEGDDGSDGADEDDALERLSDLTPQQTRILDLVCEGKLNKQIAGDLDIAESTVKAHITAILRKLKVHSRTQAVLIAQRARYRDQGFGSG